MIRATVSRDEGGSARVTINDREDLFHPNQPILVSVLGQTGPDEEVRQYWTIAREATDLELVAAASNIPIVVRL